VALCSSLGVWQPVHHFRCHAAEPSCRYHSFPCCSFLTAQLEWCEMHCFNVYPCIIFVLKASSGGGGGCGLGSGMYSNHMVECCRQNPPKGIIRQSKAKTISRQVIFSTVRSDTWGLVAGERALEAYSSRIGETSGQHVICEIFKFQKKLGLLTVEYTYCILLEQHTPLRGS